MRKRELMFFLLAVFLVGSFIGNVSARGDVFVVDPTQEVIETIELAVSDMTSADVCGNFSVIDGFIDFYVTSPSGIVLLCYNKTAFNRFNFAAVENGTYVMHLANTWSTNNVTVTLNYGANWQMTLQAEISPTWHTISVWEMTVQPMTPFDWTGILNWVWRLISAIPALVALPKLMLKFLRWLYWKIKHGKSKTPVVISFPVDKTAFLARAPQYGTCFNTFQERIGKAI